MNMNKKWVQIASADDDMISSELLRWSNLYDVWSHYELDDKYDFTNDVFVYCDNAWVERKVWDHDMPERNGVWHVVETNNESLLKKEVRSILANLLWKERIQIRKRNRENQRQKSKEAEQTKRKPRNSKFLCTIDIWDDFAPTTYEYHIQLVKYPSPNYWLWVRGSGYWTNTKCFLPVGIDEVSIGMQLLKNYFRSWPVDVVHYDAGDILSIEDIESLECELS